VSITSAINYFFSQDFISFGIFAFAGLAFILLSIEPIDPSSFIVKKRLNRYVVMFFTMSAIFLLYWIFAGKLKIISPF